MPSQAAVPIYENGSTTWTYVGEVVIVAHRRGALAESGFDQFHNSLEARTGTKAIIVLAHDSPPGPGQRAAIQKWFLRTKARGAVLTDSLLARGGVTALSWFRVPIAAFARTQFDAALDFVRVSVANRTDAHAVLVRLERESR